jgi:type IV pilus assembly protein PilO
MDDFLDRFNSYPLAQKLLMFGILVVVIFLGFWFLDYSPMLTEQQNKESQLGKLLDRKEELKNLKESQAKVLDKVQELRAQILLAEDKLPSSAQLPQLLKHIHDKAKTAGLEIKNFQRKSEKSEKYYYEIPVEMELEGTYMELANFLQFVSNMNRIVNIRNLSLGRKKDSRGKLEISALATTYRYKEGQQTGGGKKK